MQRHRAIKTIAAGVSANAGSSGALHPAWIAFIRHCHDLRFGEIAQLKIQDGLPVMAEEITKKVKFI